MSFAISKFCCPLLGMHLDEYENLLAEVKTSSGSSSPILLWELVTKLVVAIRELMIALKKKDEDSSTLKTKVFGASSESARHAEQHLIEASTERTDISDPDGGLTQPDTEAGAAPLPDPEVAAALAAKLKELKELKAEARSLQKKMRPDESKKIKTDPARVPNETIRRRVPDDLGVICPICNGAVADKGLSQRTREIDVLPSPIIEREYLLHKGACPCGSVTFVMPGPDRGVEQTIFSPRFVAKLIYNKFFQHLPVYRQAQALATEGLKISRQRLTGLMLNAFATLEPIVAAIRKVNREEPYQNCDESPVTTVIAKIRQLRYIWTVVTEKAITFEITEKRNRKTAQKIIGSKPGVLTTDRLSIYALIFAKISAACMAHCRRKFWYALASFPREAIKIIRLIGALYNVEREARLQGLTADQRLELRQTKSLPILEQITAAMKEMDPPPRSSLGTAINYTREHWKELTYFMGDGKVGIDNNCAEGALRPPKLGWKNFLFAQSELGCDAIAGFYTLIATCVKYDIDPVAYLTDVLARLSRHWSKPDIESLLPWNWKPPAEGMPPIAPQKKERVEVIPGAKVIELVRMHRKLSKLANGQS